MSGSPALAAYLGQKLAELEGQHLRRFLLPVARLLPRGRVLVGGRELLNLAANDYLGLSQDPRLVRAAQEAAADWGVGSGASRLISGTLALHQELEAEIAAWKGTEAAVIFNTGYMANVGVIAALMEQGGLILSDRLNHASIIDGMRLAGASFRRFGHRDLNQLEDLLKKAAGQRLLIVTDSVFSVDGDLAPLRELVELKEKYGAWLMIDEAHASGVFGPRGAGLAAELGLTDRIEIHLGTFSKALGSFGAYVAGSRVLIEYLHNRARSFIFSTALPPPVLGAIREAVRIVQEEAEPRTYLRQQAAAFRHRLQTAGFDTLGSASQIVPVLLGDNARALEFAAALRDHGLFAVAIRPPTVPPGTARVRFSLSAVHAAADLAAAANTIITCGQALALIPSPSAG